jgi:hypothetical protein
MRFFLNVHQFLAMDMIERLTFYFNFQRLMYFAIPFLASHGALLATMSSSGREYLISTRSPARAAQVLVLKTAFAFPVHLVLQFGFATT